MTKYYLTCLFVGALISFPAGGDLDKAWQEFDFQNYPLARSLFEKVIQEQRADPDMVYSEGKPGEIVQARMGLAMITHFEQPGNDPQEAFRMYKEILAELDEDHPVRANAYLLMGKALMDVEPPKVEEAQRNFDTVLDTYPGSPEAHEAALEKAFSFVHESTEANIHRAVRFLRQYCDSFPDNPLVSTMYNFSGRILLRADEPRLALDYLLDWAEVGPVNIREVNLLFFRIARVYDKVIENPDSAIVYYRKFYENDRLDPLAFYCRRRIEQLSDGSRQ